ncbi:D-lactate ferricytochrome c oxidoreductase [Mycoemilia scoparia]|uniref:D-lactate dehydrogenase (cytochrome) n=1 Tax=Mycoemilia scoparia TaxID=417184 RepID=A0A9W8DKG1_9FUNG|nr:D-lactate ferricytochrome c oxidoreductase [Mycoemilia scoparia]
MTLPNTAKPAILLTSQTTTTTASAASASAASASAAAVAVASLGSNLNSSPFKSSARSYADIAIERNPQFKKITKQDIDHFKTFLEPQSILATTDIGGTIDEAKELDGYNTDWLGKYKGRSQVVLRPKSTQQVSKILKYCNDQKIAVVPQGGNTGLVGGGVPVFDEVIVSLGSMNNIRDFNETSGILVCDSGCILEELDKFAAGHGFSMPLDLGAKGSCHIGGNVSTNAGGIRFIRYGSLHGSVLGLEVVLPDGTIVDNLGTLPKDSTGYDLKQLFIGAEGTLGIVTGVSIVTPPRPNSVNVAVLGVSSYDAVQKAFRKVRRDLAEVLSAFEFWDTRCMQIVLDHNNLRSPLEEEHPFYILIETSGSKKDHDDEKLAECLESLLENEIIDDGALAQDETQVSKMWSMREGIPESLGKWGPTYKYDISIPIGVLYDIVPEMANRLEQAGLYSKDPKTYESASKDDPNVVVKGVLGYGHIGDGNLHLNVVANRFDKKVTDVLEPYVYEWVASHKGSISAEHGLGLMKAPHLHYSKSKVIVDWMVRIKNAFDPNGIMNPYKFLPRTTTSSSN